MTPSMHGVDISKTGTLLSLKASIEMFNLKGDAAKDGEASDRSKYCQQVKPFGPASISL